jgi:hypothetical protein
VLWVVLILTERERRSIEELARQLELRGLVSESQNLRDILRIGSERREVRASVAARILHVTSQTIRNWVKQGRIPGRIDDTSHVFVSVEALQPALELDAAMPHQPPSEPEVAVDDVLDEIEEHRFSRHSA